MIGIVDATLKVTGFKQLQEGAKKAGQSVDKLASDLDKASAGFKAMGIAAGAAFAGMVVGANKALKAFDEQIRAERSLEVAFSGLGEGAADASREIRELAASLQQTTTFGDEATIKAAAFLRIQGMTRDQIKSALPVIQDLAAVTGMELSKASILAGRAMTGSVKVLERYIGTVDEATAATINGLGPQEKAAAVADLLREKVGGQAQILRQSGVGAMTAYSNAVGDLWEEMGRLIDRPVQEFFEGMTKSVQSTTETLTNLQPWAKETLVTVGKWALVFTGAATAIAGVALVLPQIVAGLKLMAAAWAAVKVQVIAALLPMLKFAAVAGALVLVIAGLRKTWSDFGDGFVFQAREMFLGVLDIVIIWSRNVQKLFNRVLNKLLGGVRRMINTLGQLAFALGFEDLARDVKAFENISFKMDLGWLKDAAQGASEIASKAFTATSEAAATAGGGIADAFGKAFDHVRDGFGLLQKDLESLLFVEPTAKAAKAAGVETTGAAAAAAKPAGAAAISKQAKAVAEVQKKETESRKANVAAYNAQAASDLRALQDSGAKMVAHYEQQADAFDRIVAHVEAQEQKLGNTITAIGQTLQGNIGALAMLFAQNLGPVGEALVGLGVSLLNASAGGKALQESLKSLFNGLAQVISPLVSLLVPIVDAFRPLLPVLRQLFNILLTLSLLEPALSIVALVIETLAGILQTLVFAFRSLYIELLRFVQFITFGAIDFTNEIAELEAANRSLMRPTQQAAEGMERVAGAAERASQSFESYNVPSGFKINRAAFNADQGIAPGMANDFISRPGQGVQRFSPGDTIVGFNGEGPLGGGGTTYNIGEVIIQGVDNPEDFWEKITEAVRFEVQRGGASLPVGSQFFGV